MLRVLAISKSKRGNTFIQPNRYSHLLAYCQELEKRSLLKTSYPTDIVVSCHEKIGNLPPCLYAGFDPTADSLHIGNLLILLNLIRGAQFGCHPIALVGGFTALVGDPSGRKTERDPIREDTVRQNGQAIMDQIRRIGENCQDESGIKLLVVDNKEWLAKMTPVSIFRHFGNFRVSHMLKMGAIRSRMSENLEISLQEFVYQTLQAYDWQYLSDKHRCYFQVPVFSAFLKFQIGGSDQLGHLDFGAHYIKRTRENAFAAGVCLPLLTDKDGNKLGKSVGGGIWLASEKTSPFHFFQFFRQLHDTEAIELVPKFSLRSFEEVVGILEDHQRNLGKWIAQEALATELTRIVHGSDGLETALRCSRALFQGSIEDVKCLSIDDLLSLFGGASRIEKHSIKTFGDFAKATRKDSQPGDVLMRKGAFKINGDRILDPARKFDPSSVILPNTTNLVLICWGKRKFQLVQLV